MLRRKPARSLELKPRSPYMLRRWKVKTPTGPASLFTCGRPGRGKSKTLPVADDMVHSWTLGLPGPNTAIVSLLGNKLDGTSEYSFYSFRGGRDTEEERGNCQTFQEWLFTHHNDLGIVVREFPTIDHVGISRVTLDMIIKEIRLLISHGRTVVIVDSGGETRTGIVCRHMGAKEDSSTNDSV